MSQTVPPDSGFLQARRVMSLVPGLRADSVWWSGGRVRAVGPAHEVDALVPRGTPRFELPSTLVTPGFVDGHTHFALWALNRERLPLAGLGTREAVIAAVGAATGWRGWVIGQGWDANGWDRPPERGMLDRVQSLPVYLDSLDVHSAWVNSAALAAAGIGRDTPDPFGGRIVRDAVGMPTGLLLERAVDLMTPHLPVPPPDALDSALFAAQEEAHRLGVTGIHNVETLSIMEAMSRLDRAGALRLRVLFHPPVEAMPGLIQAGRRSGQGSDWLTMGGVKMFLDGSLGSRTAWMLDPYEGSRDRGMPITAEAEAATAMRMAAEAGIACAVHAIGDAAVRRALDLMTALPRAALPHRIEHFQCVHPSDLSRAARHGIVLSMQPAHLLTDVPLIERHWGRRGAGAYAFRTLLATGSALVFGSDVPVASIDPREGVFAALERRAADGTPAGGWRPEERLSLEQAVRAYTANAAAAGGVAARRGTLGPGQDADLVAWDVDPAADRDDGAAFRAARAVLTVVAGAVVFER